MLILSRKRYEAIVIGDDIGIVILESSRGVVKVGIDAPKNLRIDRAYFDILTNKIIKKDMMHAKSILSGWGK